MRSTTALALLLSCALAGLAAGHPHASNCTVTVGGHTFDLSPLSGGASFRTDDQKFTLNPCGEASKPGESCPSGCSGYQLDGAAQCWCLGKLGQATYTALDHGLQIDFGGGSARTNPSGTTELDLTLTCAESEVKPSTVNEDPIYHYQTEWKTPAACKGPTPTPTPTPQDCTVTVGGHTFDLSPLSGGASFQTGGSFPEYYTLNPCGEASKPDESCPSGCSGYQLDGAHKCWCLGKLDQATYTALDHGLQIDFGGGSARTNPSGIAALELRLTCAESEAKPSRDSEDPVYHYQIEWKTPAACQTPIPTPTPTPTPTPQGCDAIVDGLVYPTSLLGDISFTNGYTGYINLCGMPKPVWYCDVDNCAAYRVNNGQCECLGLASTIEWSQPEFGVLEAKFTNGTSHGWLESPNSLRVRLLCGSKTTPNSFNQGSDNSYTMGWSTIRACSDRPSPTPTPTPTPLGRPCDARVDGTVFPVSYASELSFKSGGSKFYLHPCGASRPADHCTAGCAGYRLDENNDCWCLGLASEATWQLVNDRFHLNGTFTGGVDPDGQTEQTLVIGFGCASRPSTPTIYNNLNMWYVQNWVTPFACDSDYPTTIGNVDKPGGRMRGRATTKRGGGGSNGA